MTENNNFEEVSLLAFRAISSFVSELGNAFSKNQKSLALYARLVSKTKFLDDDSISRHISSFRKFCVDNREPIKNKDGKGLTQKKITYSERVFIDMGHIFSLLSDDKETENVIWAHIHTICALVDPDNRTKDMLVNPSSEEDGEEKFINKIVEKLQDHVKPGTNPMQAISSITSSGLINELITDMNDGFSSGKLDLTKLMGMVQGMAAEVDTSSNPAAGSMLNNLTSMLPQLTNSLQQ